MTRSFHIQLVLLLLTITAQAQEAKLDQQKIKEGRAKPDTHFVRYLIQASTEYGRDVSKNDSSEVILSEAIRVAEKIGYTQGLLEAREGLGQYYFQKGKLSQSLNVLLKNDALAIQLGDSTRLFTGLRVIASVYMRIGDMNMALTSLNRRQFIIDHNGIKGLKDTSYHVLSQYNSLATYYVHPKINKPDSVGYYYRKIQELGKNTAASNLWIQLSNGGLGRYFTAYKQYDSAIYYYKIAAASAAQGKRNDNYYGFLSSMAEVYQKAGMLDSAYAVAYKVYHAASQFSYLSIMSSSSGLLANLYKQEHRYDSAIKYMALESQYKDSLAGQEALKSIQVITSEQQLKDLERQREKEEAVREYKARQRNYLLGGGIALLLLIIGLMYRVNKQRAKSKKQIELAYQDLKTTQAQLIQSEKMASLGELTAGIAHEIQNPLNFVNNFSEVNKELLEELEAERLKAEGIRNEAIETELLEDIKQNSVKINEHGKRADAIVKGMLQHSRSSSGQKELTNINALVDEYLRLAYHGLRAKDKSFNATLQTDYHESAGMIRVIPQDMGRVLLNLITNAFYAVTDKKKTAAGDLYEPTVSVSTWRTNDRIEIKVKDNANGIPEKILDKIFQPFFTTKPTGEGTGLGLSLSYDIVKAHGGELQVESTEGAGSTFSISIPITSK